MKDLKTRKLNIGQLGTIKINVPVLSLGDGKKRVVILCGIHGDEKSGLFVVHELIKDIKNLKGRLDIVLAANPLAQCLGMRVSPNDFHDLNRIFPGSKETDFSHRLADRIFKFCRGAAVVIDLHTFQDSSPIVAIFVNSGSETTKKRCLELISVFKPQAIWKVNFKSAEESRLSGALGSALASQGVANFAVEMPEVFLVKDKQIQRVKKGILRVLGFLGLVKTRKTTEHILAAPIFERLKVRAKKAGLFTPTTKIMAKVKSGDIIGKLVSLPELEEENITSPQTGILLIIKQKDLVATGDVLFSIGRLQQ